jgi:ribose-phosphate pyrophosphokinase
VGTTHPVLSGLAVKNLKDLRVEEIVATNTVQVPSNKKMKHLTILSVGTLLAEAIKRIHSGESVGALFT